MLRDLLYNMGKTGLSKKKKFELAEEYKRALAAKAKREAKKAAKTGVKVVGDAAKHAVDEIAAQVIVGIDQA